MATIYVDNQPYTVKDGQNLLHACLSLGFNIPYFCWHPAMHSVGACRQCAVKQFSDENDKTGHIVMSCMTPATDGTRISIDDPEAWEFRRRVIEWLMVNHPHDCPVCDEGGECHLQDMTVMAAHAYREYRFKKRTYRNQDLGPLVTHEMNRCIQCYRCVRFYRDYAGGRDLNVFGWHDGVYFGRDADGTLQSEFSGNLVEVCPTGVFTDKTLYGHYTRKWDLQTAPSVCVHCSLGCNTTPGERYGQLRRIRNRFNWSVNGYFLCDRGRYGYEFVNSPARLTVPMHRADRVAPPQPISPDAAIALLANWLHEPGDVVGIGSPRASLEANFALARLCGPQRFFAGTSRAQAALSIEALEILQSAETHSPSLQEIASAQAVFVLGEDVTNSAPRMALALRQAARNVPVDQAQKKGIPQWNDYALRDSVNNRHGPFYLATPYATKLDDLATTAHHGAPADLARLGLAVAHAIHSAAPAVEGLSGEQQALAQQIADDLKNADRPLIVCGTTCGSAELLHAAANVAMALKRERKNAHLAIAFEQCNSVGLTLLRDALSQRDNQAPPADSFGDPKSVLAALRDGARTLVVLESDLAACWDAAIVAELFAAARHVIVLDHIESATTRQADLVLPCATFAQSQGTLVNNEGRAQRFFKVMPPGEIVTDSWRWLRDMLVAAGRAPVADIARNDEGETPATQSVQVAVWETFDDIAASMAQSLDAFASLGQAAPDETFRINGQEIPRQPQRYSGRTAMDANVDVHEPPPPRDPDSPLAFSMEGYGGQPPAALATNFWAPGWNSIQALNKFQDEVGGPLRDGGPSGVMLIETTGSAAQTFFVDVPHAFDPQTDGPIAVPRMHIFGSESLSMFATALATLAPKPYLAVGPDSPCAQAHYAQVSLPGRPEPLTLPVQLDLSLPPGVVALPIGLPDMGPLELPTRCQVRPSQGGDQ